MKRVAKTKPLGRFIVVNPTVRNGQPVFRGTEITVSEVLNKVAEGIAWETIVNQYDGRISPKAIAEALDLASEAFVAHAHELDAAPESA